MDIQAVASQLMGYLGSDPSRIAQFAEHPYSTTSAVTGSDETISKKDMSRILTQVAAQANGQELGTTDTKDLASALMSQSGGSVHALASSLFGGGGQAAGSGAAAGGFDLSSVLGSLSGGASNSSGAPSMAEIAAKSIAGGLAARGMAALITSAMGAAKKGSQGQ